MPAVLGLLRDGVLDGTAVCVAAAAVDGVAFAEALAGAVVVDAGDASPVSPAAAPQAESNAAPARSAAGMRMRGMRVRGRSMNASCRRVTGEPPAWITPRTRSVRRPTSRPQRSSRWMRTG